MKKTFINIFAFFFFFSFISGVFATGDTCDENFYFTLRQGKTYNFWDDIKNTGSVAIKIKGYQITSKEEWDYNNSPTFPTYVYTSWITGKAGIIKPNESGRLLETTSTYPVIYHPQTRSYNNLKIVYAIKRVDMSGAQEVGSIKTHTECANYEISWCGDGVLDTNYGETCDPSDVSKKGWGDGGCDATCKPIETTPSCNSLTVNPASGDAPVSSSVVCTGYKVNTFKIDCGNGQVFTGNGSGKGIESLTKTCTYSNAGTYTPTCYINDTITNNSCKKTVNIGCATNPAIKIDKSDFNLDDKDGVVGNDRQTVNKGAKAVFKIRVTNTGTESLKEIKITDTVAPKCAGNVTLPGTYPSTWSNFQTGGTGNKTDTILEPGEFFEYTCEKEDTQSMYVNTADVEGTGVGSRKKVTDSDDTCVDVYSSGTTPAIQIDKTDSNSGDLDDVVGNDRQTVNKGAKAIFKIRVTNIGTESLKEIKITDTVAPKCAGNVTLPGTYPSTWSNFTTGGNGNKTDTILEPGEYFEYTCEKEDTQAKYINTADVEGTGVDSDKKVTDSDYTCVEVKDISGMSCDNLSVSPTTGTNTLTSQAICTGTKVNAFRIDCGNGQIFTGTGAGVGQSSFSGTCSYSSKGTYNPICYVNTDITSDACKKSVSVTGSPSSSSSSSGGPSCTKIEINKNTSTGTGLTTQLTCYGNTKARRFRIDCGNGQEIIGEGELESGLYGTKFSATCSYSSNSSAFYLPKCYVGTLSTDNPYTSSYACTTKVTLGGGSGGGSYCGDGVLQRPNSAGQYEQCEKALDANGKVGVFPSFCTNDCKVRFTTIPSSCKTKSCVITIPNEGEIIFGPTDRIIIGNAMNPFKAIVTTPYIKSESSYDLYLDKLCVFKKTGNTLDGAKQCTSIGTLYPGSIVKFPTYPDFKGNTSTIPAGNSYADNMLITTIEHDGTLYENAYFAQELEVRVAKPSVVTTGGGTSYVKDSSKIADVSNVSYDENKNDNKNFVGTSVSGLSSYSKDKVDTSVKDKIQKEAEKYSQSTNKLVSGNTGVGTITGLVNVTKKYNGIKNVFILKGQNLSISTIPNTVSGPRTYIIEDGDLIINGNLDYKDNIAFVVKGGDIKIKDTVTELDGVYISIAKSGIGGAIKGNGVSTNEKLLVNGSLYGDISSLVDERTYVKSSSNGQLNVGTIVSFASGLFRKPAPLVSQFIEEYMDSQKIAK